MKRFFITLIALILFIPAAGCTKQNLKFDIGEASKITIFSGSTGKSAEITDEQAIQHITDNINSLSFSKDKSSKGYEGFAYEIVWYDEADKQIEIIRVMQENRISYRNYFFDNENTDGSIDMSYIESLLSD